MCALATPLMNGLLCPDPIHPTMHLFESQAKGRLRGTVNLMVTYTRCAEVERELVCLYVRV